VVGVVAEADAVVVVVEAEACFEVGSCIREMVMTFERVKSSG
jgi:hypothetical protein